MGGCWGTWPDGWGLGHLAGWLGAGALGRMGGCWAFRTNIACPLVVPAVPAVQNPRVTEDREFNGFGTNIAGSPEPIYGQLFLPRKFKVAVTGAGFTKGR